MPGRIELDVQLETPQRAPRPRESEPMRILVLGNFTASSGSSESAAISKRLIHQADIDNIDTLLGRMNPGLHLQLDENLAVSLGFSTMDDFHPDNLYRRLAVFDELRDLRKRLTDTRTYPDAAAQLQVLLSGSLLEAKNVEDVADPVSASEENDSAILERLLGRPSTGETQVNRNLRSAVENLVSNAIADQIVPDADPGQAVYLKAAEDAISNLMRRILNHPDFKALEALWRGLDFMIRRIELDENLQLFVCDLSRQELLDDISQAGKQLDQTSLYRLLISEGTAIPGTAPWSMIVGTYTFGAADTDTTTLAAMGTIASQAGGPFLSAASPSILGCRSLTESPNPHDWLADPIEAENWKRLRQSPVANWIGLALPRFLLRLPYGEATDEIDDFSFEEMTEPAKLDELLWGNPAFVCGTLIAQAYTNHGWQFEPGTILDVGDMPAYSYQDDGEWRLTPCGETCLTESTITQILETGVMPLVSLRNANCLRLLRFQSLCIPSAALAGAWTV